MKPEGMQSILAICGIATLALSQCASVQSTTSATEQQSDLQLQPAGDISFVQYDGSLPEELVIEFPARPNAGFHWPYAAVIPSSPNADAPLLVVPNNDGRADVPFDTSRYWAFVEAQRSFNRFAETVGTISLVPIFPRPSAPLPAGNLYTHALSREALAVQDPELVRLDKQLLAMAADLRSCLATHGIELAPKAMIFGFSASADFATRMALLHPSEFCAIAVGGLGALPMLPIAELEGEVLDYPLGVNDLAVLTGEDFRPEEFRSLPHLILQGGTDDNDSVPFRDSYSAAQEMTVERLFGMDLPNRVPSVRKIYADFGMPDLTIELVEGVGHSVTPVMEDKFEEFLLANIPNCQEE